MNEKKLEVTVSKLKEITVKAITIGNNPFYKEDSTGFPKEYFMGDIPSAVANAISLLTGKPLEVCIQEIQDDLEAILEEATGVKIKTHSLIGSEAQEWLKKNPQ